MLSQKRGKKAEKLAEAFLKKHKIRIIARNYKGRQGEIDIIGQEKLSPHTLIFVEVKYRRTSDFGQSNEMLKPYQVKNIKKTAQLFLLANEQYANFPCRFDLISFDMTSPLQWYKNVIFSL